MKTVKKLGNNQLVFVADGKIVFQSYETTVCAVSESDMSDVKITEKQPQSRTTAKYLNMFLQEYTNYNHWKEVK